jgi:hypothetical protein
MSSGFGSGSYWYFQKVLDLVSYPTFFLEKYDFKGLKMAFQNIILKEYRYFNLVPILKWSKL